MRNWNIPVIGKALTSMLALPLWYQPTLSCAPRSTQLAPMASSKAGPVLSEPIAGRPLTTTSDVAVGKNAPPLRAT